MFYTLTNRPSDGVQEKMENNAEIFGNNYCVEESDVYVEKTPDYAEISKIYESCSLGFFQRIKYMLTSY